eukprot:COSAG01_NODE_181_length_22873_cov_12.951392_1_plen_164_part_10
MGPFFAGHSSCPTDATAARGRSGRGRVRRPAAGRGRAVGGRRRRGGGAHSPVQHTWYRYLGTVHCDVLFYSVLPATALIAQRFSAAACAHVCCSLLICCMVCCALCTGPTRCAPAQQPNNTYSCNAAVGIAACRPRGAGCVGGRPTLQLWVGCQFSSPADHSEY